MKKVPFPEAIRAIRANDPRFDPDAYLFLRDSLDFTVKKLRGEESEEHRHVCGPELLNGLREFALKEFGPLAATVLESWGITRCEDVGDMVFQLIEVGAFGKSDEDDPADFAGVFDFDEAFREPFRPRRTLEIRPRNQGAEATPRPRGMTPEPATPAEENPKQTLN